MNERIKELWNNAAESTAAFPSGQNNSWETQVNFMDKFAELIVRECASQVRFTDLLKCNDDSDGEILLQASVQLKQHFGVEE